MAESKCSITREPCPVNFYAWDALDCKAACPIGKYIDSSYIYEPGESKSGAVWRNDSARRYYGIARAKRLEHKKFVEG